MIITDRLKGAIKEAGFNNIGKAGRAIGLAESTMRYKLKYSSFTVPEIDDMIEVFEIRHPEEIFIYGRKK